MGAKPAFSSTLCAEAARTGSYLSRKSSRTCRLGCPLRGTVTEADSGHPLDSVEVELGYWRFDDTPPLATMITGEDGRYFLEASVSRARCEEDGIYRLFIRIYEGGPTLVEMLHAECVEDEQVLDVALAETEIIWKTR